MTKRLYLLLPVHLLAAHIHSHITATHRRTGITYIRKYICSIAVHTRALNKNNIHAYCLAHRIRAHTFCENKCSPSRSHSAPALRSRRVHSVISWCSREHCMAVMPPNLPTTYTYTYTCLRLTA